MLMHEKTCLIPILEYQSKHNDGNITKIQHELDFKKNHIVWEPIKKFRHVNWFLHNME